MQKIGSKIKVLQLLEDFEIGGLERIVENIFEGLDRARYEPSIWCIAGGGKIAHKFFRKGEDIQILNVKTYHNPLNILKLAVLIRKNRFQIVHTHGYFASTMGRISAFLARTPIIISHVHTTYWSFSKRNLWVEKVLSRVSDRIICCSNAVGDFLISHERIDPEKLIRIYNGVHFKKEDDSGVREDHFNHKETRIITTASFVKNKGHRYLLEALSRIVKRHRNVRLSLVGDGPLKSDLLNYAESLGISSYIEFLGVIDNVEKILKETDIFVLPSIEREGLGIAMIEAMSQSKPVIGTDIGGIPEVIEDGVNGYLVEPRDSDSLAEKLEILIDDKNKRERMGREGRKRFEEKFDASIMLRQLEDLYESLLNQKSIGVSRVLYLHNKSNISGGEQSLINLWRNLDRKRFVPHLIIPKDGLLGQEARRLGLDVGYCDIPQLRPSMLFIIGKIFLALGQYCKKNRISIIHSYTPRNNILAAILGRLIGIPVVWHERNLIFGDERDISRKFAFLPDQIICNSQAVAERFRKKRRIPLKVKVVINGVDLKRFRPEKVNREILQKYNINGKKVVGLVSNLGKRKMPEYLMDASTYILERSPETIFLIVGGEFGEEDKGRKEQLEQRARNLGVGNQVVFTGFVSKVADIIQVFDIGAAVTEKEACSRAILETMACGKPVVAFNTGGNPELVEDGITGTLVKFGDVKGLASSVVGLLEDDERRKKMGMRARERVERYFDVKINAHETQEVYSKLAG